MRGTFAVAIAALGVVTVIVAGCGGGGGGNGGSTSYLPMATGNTWDYTLTLAPGMVPAQIPGGQEFPYNESVIGTFVADLQGTEYYVVQARRDAVGQHPERIWQQLRREDAQAIYARVSLLDPDTGVVIGAYDLPILMLPPTLGQIWTDPEFPEDTFTTSAVAEQVTVPAGTFTCVRVDWERDRERAQQREGESPLHITVRSWYARGVGLVRDETLEDSDLTSTLQLESYSVQ